jgi:TPR repeat protein
MYFEPFMESQIELAKTETNWRRYVNLLRAGVEAGDDSAIYAMGSLYVQGARRPYVKRDEVLGVALLVRACRSSPAAMLEYASFLEEGTHGVRRDPRAAVEMYRRAVKYGSIAARFNLARCLSHGVGGKKQVSKARQLLLECEELGYPAEFIDLLRSSSGFRVDP